jgi:hypothetical protein
MSRIGWPPENPSTVIHRQTKMNWWMMSFAVFSVFSHFSNANLPALCVLIVHLFSGFFSVVQSDHQQVVFGINQRVVNVWNKFMAVNLLAKQVVIAARNYPVQDGGDRTLFGFIFLVLQSNEISAEKADRSGNEEKSYTAER